MLYEPSEGHLLNGIQILEELGLMSVETMLKRGPALDDQLVIDVNEPCSVLQERQCLITRPAYSAQKLPGARKDLSIRNSVRDRLEVAASALSPGFGLIVFDGWRSAELQRSIYREIEQRSQQGEATRYAFNLDADKESVPYPADDAPHRTGGAVDVGLFGPDGLLWPMGTAFDSTVGDSATAALEGREPTNLEEKAAQLGRRLLVKVMLEAGFTNYPEEWWHWDFGNAFWRHFGKLPPGPVYRTIDL